MASTLLVVAYIAQIQASLFLIVLLLRAQRVTLARAALIVYLVCTSAWSAISLYWEVSHRSDPILTQSSILVVVAILVSGIRVSARTLEDPKWRPSRLYILSLVAHPIAMITIALVPPWHPFLVTVDAAGHSTYQTGFWIHAAVSWALVISAGLRFVRARSTIRAISRYSAAGTFLPWSIPFIANSITVQDQGAGGPDLTPVAFLFTAFLIGRTMVQDGLADIVPIARVHVFESFTDAIFVVDAEWCLVDANSRGLRLLGVTRPAAEVAGTKLADLSPEVARISHFSGEHDVELAGSELVVGVRQSPLEDVKGRTVGALIHVRDITVDVLQRRELVRVRDALADEALLNETLRAELAEQVVRDAGTGLHNRRFVFEALPVMAASCERDGVPLSVLMLDLDLFKFVNDTYGHAVGDRALQAIATVMDETSRGAVVARFGGEEFVVLMPGASVAVAVERAEAIRAACALVQIPTREGFISITLSAGVATTQPGPIDVAGLLDAADGALYEAKNSGRNRVCAVAAISV